MVRKLFWIGVCIPVAAIAAPMVPSTKAITENANFFSWFLGVSLAVMLYLFSRQVKQHEENNKRLWSKAEDHETRIRTNEINISGIKAIQKAGQ